MNLVLARRIGLPGISLLCLAHTASATLDGYWPLNGTSGTVAPNVAGTSPNATLFPGATWLTDAQRGQVLQFDGIDGYADAGTTTIPQMTLTNNFTWSFWSYDEENVTTGSNNTIIGDRYSTTGPTEFTPREFTKFTTSQFEFHRNGVAENIDYANQPSGVWVYNVVVKQGTSLTYFRDGRLSGTRTITEGMNNPKPLYFGGNGTLENWKGRLDDVAIWSDALPVASIAALKGGSATPLTVARTQAAMSTVASDNFATGIKAGLWNVTNRGLENNAAAGYNAPDGSGGKLTLGGTSTSQYWFGSSLETSLNFDSTKETLVSVDRLSLSVTGSAGRSSLWILGDDGHYLHFAQNLNEGGWSWNARDDGGLGSLAPTGTGNNIASLDSFDLDTGSHGLSIRVVPTGVTGEVFTYMYFDGTLVADQRFTNFPTQFKVALTGQARATGDTVNAQFDNFSVQQVPEPSAVMLAGLALVGFVAKRRRSA